MPHQSASGEHEVRACSIEIFINKEVLLFPSEIRIYFLDVGVKHLAYRGCCIAHCLECAFKRSLVVKRLTGI